MRDNIGRNKRSASLGAQHAAQTEFFFTAFIGK